MAITKTGNSLEKQAILHQIIGPTALHLGQNAGMSRMLRSPSYHNTLAAELLSGITNSRVAGAAKRFKRGLVGSLIPETRIMRDEARQFGGELKALGEKAGKVTDKRALVHLRRGLRGDFKKLFADPKNLEGGAIVEQLLTYTGVPNARAYTAMLRAQQNTPAFDKTVGSLEELWKTHPSLVPVRGMGEHLGKVKAQFRPEATRLEDAMEGVGWFGGTAGLVAADPLTSMVNLGKQGLALKKLPKPLKKVQNGIRKFLVNDPVRSNFKSGLKGGVLNTRGPAHLADHYVVNPAVADAKSFANALGTWSKQQGLTLDNVESAQQLYNANRGSLGQLRSRLPQRP